jgi:hypothetical protein
LIRKEQTVCFSTPGKAALAGNGWFILSDKRGKSNEQLAMRNEEGEMRNGTETQRRGGRVSNNEQ